MRSTLVAASAALRRPIRPRRSAILANSQIPTSIQRINKSHTPTVSGRRCLASVASPAERTSPFEGKVITITGAARGIGLATAKYLAARGAALSLADVRELELQQAVDSLRQDAPRLRVLQAIVDVSDAAQVTEWISRTKRELGRIDGCLNNAGIVGSGRKPIAEVAEDEWRHVLDVNLTGVFHCLRAQLPLVEDGASIVNTASAAGLFGFPGQAAYVTSKHGVLGLTKTAAKEVGARGVRVNAVCPGAVDTPLMAQPDGSKAPPGMLPQVLKRYGRPEEVAALIAFLLGDDSRFTTASYYSVDGGWVT